VAGKSSACFSDDVVEWHRLSLGDQSFELRVTEGGASWLTGGLEIAGSALPVPVREETVQGCCEFELFAML
jgi:hypothetical protein